MADINVTVPESIKDWVEVQVKSAGYESVSDYVVELISEDQERIKLMREAIEEGEASGYRSRTIEEIAADTKAEMKVG